MQPRLSRRTLLQAFAASLPAVAAAAPQGEIVARPGLYKSLTEPPCSYCITQHRKGLIEPRDRVVAWLRAAHNGGAIPVRHFLAGTRVINDTYGLFFYDPDGGFVSAFKKDYGYEFHGWRRGVMVVRGRDGTLWSALSGRAIQGVQVGRTLPRIPSLVTDWAYWLMLHPESTAYDLFDGRRYLPVDLPTTPSREAKEAMDRADTRMAAADEVLGVFQGRGLAYRLTGLGERACIRDTPVGDAPLALLWFGPTRTAAAYRPVVDGRRLTLEVDDIAPETAPFRDKETGTRWSLAGRGIDGPLKGRELPWVESLQCRWYAWAAEYPKTEVGRAPASA